MSEALVLENQNFTTVEEPSDSSPIIGAESGVQIEDDAYDVTFYDELVSTKLYLCYAEVQKKLGIDLVVKTEKSRWQLILILILVAIAIALILFFVLRVVLKVSTFGVV